TDLELDQILDEVAAHPAQHVVVTGGEPMIAPDILALTGRLRALGKHITIETAGTVFAPVACDLMSISPKLANSTPDDPRWSGQHERLRIQPVVLVELMARYEYQLKFVIQRADDLDEVRLLVELLGADRERVILMPEGTDSDRLRERGVWLAELCKEEGFRFSPRLPVDLWGNRRGVENRGQKERVPSVPGFPPRRPAPPGGDARGYANRRARRRPRSQCPFGSTRWRSRAPI